MKKEKNRERERGREREREREREVEGGGKRGEGGHAIDVNIVPVIFVFKKSLLMYQKLFQTEILILAYFRS